MCWHHGRVARNRIPCETLKTPVWKRQPRETSIAYASFRAFRDLKPGERSIARVCRELQQYFAIGHATIQLERGDAAHPCRHEPDHVI